MYDIILKRGSIIDGTGNAKPFVADIAIKNGEIAYIGTAKNLEAQRTIDASGLLVAPGFIDIQNHSDSYGALLSNPALESMLHQGITTVLVGQCGSSLAPLLRGSLGSISKWTDISGVNVNWSSMAEFITGLRQRGLGPNLANLVGHATLRRDLVGDETRELNQKEERQIESLYKRSLKEGAWGLSVGLEYSHDRVSGEQELIKLLELTAKKGRIASFHLRDEKQGIAAAINEIIFLVKSSGVRAKISHFKARGEKNINFARELLGMLDKAQKDGLEIYFDMYPYTVSTSVLYLLLPHWATNEGRDELLRKLKNKNLREEIIKEMKTQNYDYKNFVISFASIDRTLIGKNIEHLAKNQSTSPEDIVLSLIKASEDHVIIFSDSIDPETLKLFMSHPYAMIATDGSGWRTADANDRGLTHPRSFGTSAKVLGQYVREEKVLSLKDAIYKMTGLPAKFLGLGNRGLVKKGYKADLVVFSKDKIKDMSNYEYPYRHPEGIPFVIVNGQVSIDQGNYTGKMTGQVLT